MRITLHAVEVDTACPSLSLDLCFTIRVGTAKAKSKSVQGKCAEVG